PPPPGTGAGPPAGWAPPGRPSTASPPCGWRSPRRGLPPGTPPPAWPPATPTRRSPWRWPRRRAARPPGWPRRNACNCTAGSASPGSTQRTCYSSGPRAGRWPWARRTGTGRRWPPWWTCRPRPAAERRHEAARKGAPMQSVAGAGVVVTGAGSGIGAALARRFAGEGARVGVNDLNAAAADEVARSCETTAAPGDAAGEEDVAALVATARDALGEIDLFCANAGVACEQ